MYIYVYTRPSQGPPMGRPHSRAQRALFALGAPSAAGGEAACNSNDDDNNDSNDNSNNNDDNNTNEHIY